MDNMVRRAARLLLRQSRWIPVVGGAVFCALWLIAEADRFRAVEEAVPIVVFAIAIACSGFFPLVSLGIVTLVPVLQLLDGISPPTANAWPVYLAVGFVGLVIAFSAEGLARRLVLPVGVVTAILIATRMMIPSARGYWTEWIGTDRILTDFPHREHFLTLLVLALGFFVGMWALGLAGRSLLKERDLGRALTRSDLDLRIAEDRARISRDVHDALAHSLAVIVSQAEGALALQAKRPKVAGEALSNIATVGRVALTDVRSLVESIHDQDLTAVRPSIDDLGDVITRMRKVGMDATLQVLGRPKALTPSQDVAVFRIVQESLTNALKHGGPTSTARVTLDWQGTGLALLVVSSPSGGAQVGVSGGVGIAGMKERARLAGGWLTADPEGDDFIVTAFIPVETRATAGELVDA